MYHIAKEGIIKVYLITASGSIYRDEIEIRLLDQDDNIIKSRKLLRGLLDYILAYGYGLKQILDLPQGEFDKIKLLYNLERG